MGGGLDASAHLAGLHLRSNMATCGTFTQRSSVMHTYPPCLTRPLVAKVQQLALQEVQQHGKQIEIGEVLVIPD